MICTLMKKNPSNVACILTDKEGLKFIRGMLDLHNCCVDFTKRKN